MSIAVVEMRAKFETLDVNYFRNILSLIFVMLII